MMLPIPRIDETSTFFYCWTILVCFGSMLNAVFLSIACFSLPPTFSQSTQMLGTIFDIVFAIDILILLLINNEETANSGNETQTLSSVFASKLKKIRFAGDVICVFPTEIFHRIMSSPFLRLNRLLKLYRFFDFNALTEIRTSLPNLYRFCKILFISVSLIHLNACIYFVVSSLYHYTGSIESWAYADERIFHPSVCPTFSECSLSETKEVPFSVFVREYCLSFYWSALTIFTLGEQPSPNRTGESVFEVLDILLGLVLYSLILGSVGNIVTNFNVDKTKFESIADGCKRFLTYRNVPIFLQDKTHELLAYICNLGGAKIDEEEMEAALPPRLFAHLLSDVHLATLRKVKLFEECDEKILEELITKLRSRIYSPSDMICRKGEVGLEMFILVEGQVQVVSEDGDKVFVTLNEGTVLGELAILNIPGSKHGNHRTANVRSLGYSQVYVLTKDDLWATLVQYPDARMSLIEKGKSILRKDNLLVEDEEGVEEADDLAFYEMEVKLETLKVEIEKLTKTVDKAEAEIRESIAQKKRRVFVFEKLLIAELKALRRKSDESSSVR